MVYHVLSRGVIIASSAYGKDWRARHMFNLEHDSTRNHAAFSTMPSLRFRGPSVRAEWCWVKLATFPTFFECLVRNVHLEMKQIEATRKTKRWDSKRREIRPVAATDTREQDLAAPLLRIKYGGLSCPWANTGKSTTVRDVPISNDKALPYVGQYVHFSSSR